MATTTYKDHAGTVLTGAVQTLLTFGTSLIAAGAKLIGVQLVNNSANTRTVRVYLIPAGQTAAQQYLIAEIEVPASPYGTMAIPGGPWFASDGAIVQAMQVTGTGEITARVTAFQEA